MEYTSSSAHYICYWRSKELLHEDKVEEQFQKRLDKCSYQYRSICFPCYMKYIHKMRDLENKNWLFYLVRMSCIISMLFKASFHQTRSNVQHLVLGKICVIKYHVCLTMCIYAHLNVSRCFRVFGISLFMFLFIIISNMY